MLFVIRVVDLGRGRNVLNVRWFVVTWDWAPDAGALLPGGGSPGVENLGTSTFLRMMWTKKSYWLAFIKRASCSSFCKFSSKLFCVILDACVSFSLCAKLKNLGNFTDNTRRKFDLHTRCCLPYHRVVRVAQVSSTHWPAEVSDRVLQMSRYSKTERTQARWDNPQSAQPRQLEIQPGIWVIRSALNTPYCSIIISVLCRPQVFFIIICGSYLHHNKRNKDKKSQGCCPRGQCPRYWHKLRKTRGTRQERREEMLTSSKNKPRYYLSRIVPTNTWQQRNLALVEFLVKICFSHETFS